MEIRILDDHVINQIAAGEVIENPSSVVKELVENSLDAKSQEIYIEIEGGGRQLIRVSDNGCGMERDDALLSLERHATSKLRSIEDFDSLNTLGFRGEALPSIASISKLTLITAQEGKMGTLIFSHAGKIVSCKEVVRDRGTTIEVRSLFENVPVRKKFQRSPRYDTSEIVKEFNKTALAHPETHFRLISDQKVLFSTPLSQDADSLKRIQERMQTVLGNSYCTSTVPITIEQQHFSCFGAIGIPSAHRQNKSGQFLFINGRPIISDLVSEAIQAGYGTALPTHRHPIFVLHLRLSGSLIDVNVHPQKREVRLREELFLKEEISKAVIKALQVSQYDSINVAGFAPVFDQISSQSDVRFENTKVDEYNQRFILNEKITPTISSQANLTNYSDLSMKAEPKVSEKHNQSFLWQSSEEKPFILATIPGYILLEEKEGGLKVADQRRAHHRILYEHLLSSSYQRSQESQSLLVPEIFELEGPESIIVQEHLSFFHAMGIGIREFGHRTFAIDAIPHCLQGKPIMEVIVAVIEELRGQRKSSFAEKELLSRMVVKATRFAICSEKKLSKEEAEILLQKLMACENFILCPLGKAIFTTISRSEIMDKLR